MDSKQTLDKKTLKVQFMQDAIGEVLQGYVNRNDCTVCELAMALGSILNGNIMAMVLAGMKSRDSVIEMPTALEIVAIKKAMLINSLNSVNYVDVLCSCVAMNQISTETLFKRELIIQVQNGIEIGGLKSE